MKSIYLAVLILSVVRAESSGGFGFELILEALQNMQSNILDLEQALTAVGAKVEQISSKHDKMESVLNSVVQNEEKMRSTTSQIEEILNMTIDESRCPKNTNNGVYLLRPPNSTPFPVYCENGWIVIQRRFNGLVDFNRNWNDYRNGFGDVRGATSDHWLGLEKMHQITRGGSYELKVILQSYDGVEKTAKYSGFEIGSENQQYRLDFKEFSAGDAGDSLTRQKGMKFSTPDRDNDNSGKHCAEIYNSGWWFAGCYNSNLNGPRKRGSDGIEWWHFSNSYDGLDESRMLIRPIN